MFKFSAILIDFVTLINKKTKEIDAYRISSDNAALIGKSRNNDILEFYFSLKQKRRKQYNIILNSSLLLPNNPKRVLSLRILNLQIDQIHRVVSYILI